MKEIMVIGLGILVAFLFIAFCSWTGKEGWYPTGTYVNTPRQLGVYPTLPNNWWGGNYYYRLNWRPWGYHRPGYYSPNLRFGSVVGGPVVGPYSFLNRMSGPFWNAPASQVGAGPILADVGSGAGAPVPRGNPVPLEAIRWNSGPFGPMLTSIKSPKDYALGQWVKAGIGYTDNPNDFTYVDVYQLNLDPGRDLFSYMAETKSGQRIPINLRQNHDRLEDGDRFRIQGMEGKGDFVFTEADKYTYVYT